MSDAPWRDVVASMGGGIVVIGKGAGGQIDELLDINPAGIRILGLPMPWQRVSAGWSRAWI